MGHMYLVAMSVAAVGLLAATADAGTVPPDVLLPHTDDDGWFYIKMYFQPDSDPMCLRSSSDAADFDKTYWAKCETGDKFQWQFIKSDYMGYKGGVASDESEVIRLTVKAGTDKCLNSADENQYTEGCTTSDWRQFWMINYFITVDAEVANFFQLRNVEQQGECLSAKNGEIPFDDATEYTAVITGCHSLEPKGDDDYPSEQLLFLEAV